MWCGGHRLGWPAAGTRMQMDWRNRRQLQWTHNAARNVQIGNYRVQQVHHVHHVADVQKLYIKNPPFFFCFSFNNLIA